MVDEEITQVEATGLKCHRYGFFSRSGFEAGESDRTVFIDLPQMLDRTGQVPPAFQAFII